VIETPAPDPIAAEEAELMAALLSGRLTLAEHTRRQGLLNFRRLYEVTRQPLYALAALPLALQPGRDGQLQPLPDWLADYLRAAGEDVSDLLNHRARWKRATQRPRVMHRPNLQEVTREDALRALGFPTFRDGRLLPITRQLTTDWNDLRAALGMKDEEEDDGTPKPPPLEDESTLRKRVARGRRKLGLG
jgi:hypothetical protein